MYKFSRQNDLAASIATGVVPFDEILIFRKAHQAFQEQHRAGGFVDARDRCLERLGDRFSASRENRATVLGILFDDEYIERLKSGKSGQTKNQ